MSLSMRQLAEMAKVSNPYLSQIERGLFTPSAQVLKGIAGALDLSTETLYQQAGLLDAADKRPTQSVEEAIRMDRRLTQEGKQALTQVYRGLVRAGEPTPHRPAARRRSAPRQPATATGKPTSKRPSR